MPVYNWGMAQPADRTTTLDVLKRLREAGHQAYFAGGCVRDMLLGVEPADYDIATDATPQQVRKLFRQVLLVGARFGVAVVVVKRRHVEVATFRSDLSYSDGRRPDGVVYASAEADARRRDFTINGLFYDPLADEVIDYVNGRDDLRAGVVRTIGRPEERFAEDYLRLIRAVRFAARFAFAIEPATAEAIAGAAEMIASVSGERVYDELSKMLARPSAGEALTAARKLGLIVPVLGELADETLWNAAVARVAACSADAVGEGGDSLLAMGALLADLPGKTLGKIARRWGASNADADAWAYLAANKDRWTQAEAMPLAELKRLAASEHFPRLLRLWRHQEHRATGEAAGSLAAERRVAAIAPGQVQPEPLVTGADLLEMGLPEGRALGRILAELYERQLNEELTERNEALDLARRCVEEEDPSARR